MGLDANRLEADPLNAWAPTGCHEQPVAPQVRTAIGPARRARYAVRNEPARPPFTGRSRLLTRWITRPLRKMRTSTRWPAT